MEGKIIGKNMVANVIKIYAIINAVCELIVAIIAHKALDNWFITLCVLFIGIVTSFAIYAVGEVISLLQDIKDRTEATKENTGEYNSPKDLPRL